MEKTPQRQSFWSKKSLFFQIFAFEAVILLLVFACLAFFLSRSWASNQDQEKLDLARSIQQSVVRHLTANEQNGAARLGLSSNLASTLEGFYQAPQVVQINLLDQNFVYLYSSNQELINKKVGSALLPKIEQAATNPQLEKISFSVSNQPQEYEQVVFPALSEKKLGYLQILFAPTSHQGYLLPLVLSYAIALLFFGFLLQYFFQKLTFSLYLFQQAWGQKREVGNQKEVAYNEFTALRAFSWPRQPESPAKKEEGGGDFLKTDHRVAPRKPMRLVFVGVRLPELNTALSLLSFKHAKTIVEKLSALYKAPLDQYEAEFLSFEGEFSWLGFRGESGYIHALGFIKEIEKQLLEWQAESGKELGRRIDPVFLIGKGEIQFVPVMIEHRALEMHLGKEFVLLQTLLKKLDHNGIWTLASLRFELQKHCFLSETADLAKFIDVSLPLLLVGIDKPVGKPLPEISEAEGKPVGADPYKSAKTSAKEERLGMAGLLDETLDAKDE